MSGKSIYLLEDDADIQQLLKLLLSQQGYTVSCFTTVQALMGQIAERLPDLFIFDLNLPDGNGLDIATILSQGKATSQVPIIILSANVLSRMQYIQSGAWEFIAKPFDIDHLLAIVKKHT